MLLCFQVEKSVVHYYKKTLVPKYKKGNSHMTLTNNISNFIDSLRFNPHDILAIDGPCGSGKTTLASLISETYSVDVIHLDDFFLPLELRTPTRMKECGGNVHYERFHSEVIEGILSKVPFTYRRFSCATMDYAGSVTIDNNKPIVIEGSYSLREDFRSIYTQKIFLQIDSKTQQQRLIKRVGPERFTQFQELWIPKEEAYFQAYHIKDVADIIL